MRRFHLTGCTTMATSKWTEYKGREMLVNEAGHVERVRTPGWRRGQDMVEAYVYRQTEDMWGWVIADDMTPEEVLEALEAGTIEIIPCV